jgi:hypothetical protein
MSDKRICGCTRVFLRTYMQESNILFPITEVYRQDVLVGSATRLEFCFSRQRVVAASEIVGAVFHEECGEFRINSAE